MVERKDVGGWLEGPGAGTSTQEYPGQRLGRPARGSGSVARFGRRFAALLVDWAACTLIAWGIFDVSLTETGVGAFVPNVIFFVENVMLVGTLGSTLGHRLLGLQVTRVGGAPAGPLKALVRSALLSLGLPALFWNADQRGLHDQAAGTIIVRR